MDQGQYRGLSKTKSFLETCLKKMKKRCLKKTSGERGSRSSELIYPLEHPLLTPAERDKFPRIISLLKLAEQFNMVSDTTMSLFQQCQGVKYWIQWILLGFYRLVLLRLSINFSEFWQIPCLKSTKVPDQLRNYSDGKLQTKDHFRFFCCFLSIQNIPNFDSRLVQFHQIQPYNKLRFKHPSIQQVFFQQRLNILLKKSV